jgi:tripeptide aminopeptidase
MDLRLLLESPGVQHARARIRALDQATLELQVTLARIPSPPGEEAERGEQVRRLFMERGLADVHADEVGNIHGHLPAAQVLDAGAAPVLVTAHLDTVFPRATDLTPRRENGRILVPGIADNARGLAALLTLAEIMREGALRTRRPVIFIATVGEEGVGDLRGVKHLFRAGADFREAEAFVSLDGSGLRRIVQRAVGSKRLRLRIRGSGGHSWSDWGLANPLHALGAAIAAMREIELATSPRSTLTVARAGGGTSVNAIPAEAWLELDLRSEGRDALAAIEPQVRERVAAAVEGENRGRREGTPALETEWEVIGDRPGGETPEAAALVQAAMQVTRALGAEPELVSSSTDANVPISLGVPAITVGAGGESGGIHTTDEWYSNDGGPTGIERALLLTLAIAGLERSE